MSVDSMAYGPDGRIVIRFDRSGLERLLDALNDNNRGESFYYIQNEPGTAEIVWSKLSWAQRLEVMARRNQN